MKVLSTILLMFVLQAGILVSAQERRSSTNATVQKQDLSDNIEISAYENKIVVANAPIGSILQIYSVVGIKVKEIEMKQASGEYVVNIAKGYYIIRITDTAQNIETARKVVIR